MLKLSAALLFCYVTAGSDCKRISLCYLVGRLVELCNVDLISLPWTAGGHLVGLLLLHHPGRHLHCAGVQGMSTLLSGKPGLRTEICIIQTLVETISH